MWELIEKEEMPLCGRNGKAGADTGGTDIK